MTKIEREIRRRERRRLADLNRNNPHVFSTMLRITLIALGVAICVAIWLWAAAAQAAAEAWAAPALTATWQEGAPVVGPIPEAWPEEKLPDAIDPAEVATMPDAVKTEAVGERWESLGTFKISHYCACRKCSGPWGHRTSSGATCQEGVTVAVDPRILPEGAVIRITGYGDRIVQDTGSGVRGRHIDVFYESHQECLDRGIKYREVLIKR